MESDDLCVILGLSFYEYDLRRDWEENNESMQRRELFEC